MTYARNNLVSLNDTLLLLLLLQLIDMDAGNAGVAWSIHCVSSHVHGGRKLSPAVCGAPGYRALMIVGRDYSHREERLEKVK